MVAAREAEVAYAKAHPRSRRKTKVPKPVPKERSVNLVMCMDRLILRGTFILAKQRLDIQASRTEADDGIVIEATPPLGTRGDADKLTLSISDDQVG